MHPTGPDRPPRSRDELLDHVYGRARQLWWRRRVAPLAVASALLVALAATPPLLRNRDGAGTIAVTGRGSPSTTEVDVGSADDPAATTTTVAASSPAGTNKRGTPGGRAPSTAAANVPEGFLVELQPATADSGIQVVLTRYDFTFDRRLYELPRDAEDASAEWSPAYDRIALSWCVGGKACQVRTLTPDGRLSTNLHDGAHPTWSPDGKWLLTRKGEQLWVVNADGGAATMVSPTGGSTAVWSPDSTRIAYWDATTTSARIVSRAGVAQRTVADPKGSARALETGPAWAPDGRRILVGVQSQPANPSDTVHTASVVDVNKGSWKDLDGDWNALGWMPDSTRVLLKEPRNFHIGDRGCVNDRPIVAVSTDSGARQNIGSGCSVGLSPDDQWMTLVQHEAVRLIPIGDLGPGTVLHASSGRAQAFGWVSCCEWTPKSDAVLFADDVQIVKRIDGKGEWRRT